MRRARKNEEDCLQATVVQHIQLRGAKGLVWFAVPNGGKRNVVEAVKLKRTGVRAGVSDLIFLHQGRSYALELKTEAGRPTESQIEFIQDWREAGGFGVIVNGLDRALKTLSVWGLIK